MALVAFCCIAIIMTGIAGYTGVKAVGNIATCPVTMGLAGSSLKEYAKETGSFPSAETWQEDIASYYNKRADKIRGEMEDAGPFKSIIQVQDIANALTCNKQNPTTGIYFNAELAGKKWEDYKDKTDMVLLFEDKGSDKNGARVFKKRTGDSDATVFGEKRPWFEFTLGEEFDSMNQGTIKVNTGSSDDEEPASDEEKSDSEEGTDKAETESV